MNRLSVSAAAVAAIALALALASACRPARRRPPNIVLLSIDTLRADHLGCYGYARRTSPVIDGLAARATLYEEARAATPWTLPSHAGLLTGVHPWHLGMLDENSVIPERAPRVAEALSRVGYQTAALVDSGPGGFVGGRRGFARGFASFYHAPFESAGQYKYDMRATARAADRWLAARDRRQPFLLFLHTKSVHDTPEDSLGASDAPYDKPREYLERFLPGGRTRFSWHREGRVRGGRFLRDLNERIARGTAPSPALSPEQVQELVDLYDAGIYYVDEQVGVLLEILKRHGVQRETVVVVTADHGEAFLEHRFLHHREVYEPLLRVPLIVYDPRVDRGRRLATPVALEDVAASVIELAGGKADSSLDGRPLPESDVPTRKPRALFAFYRFKPDEGYEAYALSLGRFKIVRHQLGRAPWMVELYDLARDPHEREAASAESAEGRALLADIEARLRTPGAAEMAQPDAQTLEELRALGYTK